VHLIYNISPKLKDVLAGLVLRVSVGDFLFSIYRVKLRINWEDVTFRFCASWDYGAYFSKFLLKIVYNSSFIDIAANLGPYCLIASQNKCDAIYVKNIYAFEPNPMIYEFLITNAGLNNANISSYRVAIAASGGEKTTF